MTSTRSDVIDIDKVVTMLCIGGYFPSIQDPHRVDLSQESGPRQGQVWIYILCLFFYTQFDITLSLVDLLKDLITSFFHDNL